MILYVLMAIFAPYLTAFDPTANSYDSQFVAPNAQFPMGTDEWGRDILTRVLYGSRTALFVGFTCAIVGSTVGLVLGVGSAYFGGIIDLIFQRIMDVFMAFPLIIMALAIVSITQSLQVSPESSVYFVIIAITLPLIPNCARVVRSSALCIDGLPNRVPRTGPNSSA